MTAISRPGVVEQHVVGGTVQFQEGAVRPRNGVHEHILLRFEVRERLEVLVEVVNAGKHGVIEFMQRGVHDDAALFDCLAGEQTVSLDRMGRGGQCFGEKCHLRWVYHHIPLSVVLHVFWCHKSTHTIV